MSSWAFSCAAGRFEDRRGTLAALARGLVRVAWLSIAGLSTLACAPKVSVGGWQCPAADVIGDGGASPVSSTDPVPVPWSTGFEDGFCGYPTADDQSSDGPGFCYGDKPYALVTEPHRPGGHYAAEFSVIGDMAHAQNQTRCVRQGKLPDAAYYGAWYFIPEALVSVQSAWNLFHFTGGDAPGQMLGSLWDVHLNNAGMPAGQWELVVYDPLAKDNDTYSSAAHKPVPIGSWFHIVLFLKRAADSSGEIALYQDDELLFDQSNLKSDASNFGQWYVGDWAPNAVPLDSSLYVDDVSISATLDGATQ